MSNRQPWDAFPRCPNCDASGRCMYVGPCLSCTIARHRHETLYAHEIDCAYEQNVSAFEIASAPVHEIRTGTGALVRITDFIDATNLSQWATHFVAIVDAENDLVALVPRPISGVIVKVLNKIEGATPDEPEHTAPWPGCVHPRLTDTLPARCVGCGEIVGRPK